jgi:NADPH-dependent ferric siderophore reductase
MAAIRTEIRNLTKNGAPPFNCAVTVESVAAVSPGFRRVAVRGDGLADYAQVRPADAFKIMVPPDGAGTVDFPQRGADGIPYWPEGTRQPVLRAFTVRHFDASARRLEFDAMAHDGGVAMAWLGNARPGDVIGLGGMRREFHAGDVDRHLIVGDSSALPAIAAIVESLEPGTPTTVHLAVGHDDDRNLVPAKDGVTIHWVTGGSPAGPDSALERAVREQERPDGRVQAWLGAEASVVRGLRRFVTAELGVGHDDLHAAAYWKAGINSTDNDTVLLQRYVKEISSGADASDPDVREKVELEV